MESDVFGLSNTKHIRTNAQSCIRTSDSALRQWYGEPATSEPDSTVWPSHMSSIWPWSSVLKVQLYGTFLSSLRHSPPRMKNQHGLNEENNLDSEKLSSNRVQVMWHVLLVWVLITKRKTERKWRMGKRWFLMYLFNLVYKFSSSSFTLWIFILSDLFPHWTLIVPFVWNEVIFQGSYLNSALWSIPSFRTSTFDQPGNYSQSCLYFPGQY